MESHLSNNDYPTLDSDSTTALQYSDLPNHQRNRIATGYSADDEYSELNGDKSTSVFKTRYDQDRKITADYRNSFRQTQKRNFWNPPRSDSEQKKGLAYPCACNPYETMHELKLLKLAKTTCQQNPQLSEASTCRLKSKCAKWIENKFTDKYGRHFSEDLVFAVDVVMLIRNLNGLSFQYIIYPTTNSAPESPCNKTIDRALTLIRNRYADILNSQILDAMNGEGSYKKFQTFLLKMTRDWEEHFEEREFLFHCAMIGQWAVCAEKMGVKQATYFAPLVICRMIHRLRIWTTISPRFWKNLVNAAEIVR
ncbi:hypothetical protein HNY73_009130 [Argiope bruennichi]|uniref:Uncharacterized protein n=1 Tax=Argiope bruennichi TaxID=94029 RepID=A0A8T0F8M3_ARGBR|nr:hypothetical protein HNY73_009130 [Argiope bruennichi]